MFKHFKENKIGRDFIVGDIHGMFRLLDYKLIELGFDETKDRLFSVGDLIDRGPESHEFEDWLAKPWFHAVLGNHEQMLIDAVEGDDRSKLHYYHNGGDWMFGLPTVQQQCYAILCKELPIAIEVETKHGLVGIVHAECPLSDWNLFKNLYDTNKEYFTQVAIWARMRASVGDDSEVAGLHKLYVGHTVVGEGTTLGNVHYIDTGAVFTGKMTILQIN